ncbi:pseudouridine synthase [Flavihumibacter petaseus]|uniref:Pseudouridine synthase n=1 Tax=Flavihumibacter petaseus NBRC 106054 TaxID=1220578 RepID=A0A0E9N654_9BACT|nr:pseudouridine synthase [Flavihumibacter petaseus]GAO45186.1 pseudouridine synthase [Flavihumibacter petaseus NBRC 106054]
MNTYRYFALHKPRGMVSQFVSPDPVRLLGEIEFDFPPGIHAIGRLDADSEGLLLLTTDGRVTRLLFKSEVPHQRTYLVRVKGTVKEESLDLLRSGIILTGKGNGDFQTLPCTAEIVGEPAALLPIPGQEPQFPHTWLRLNLVEGKYRQVRKMVASIGHRCQRLVRVAIEDLELGDLPPGEVREYTADEFFRLLHLYEAPNTKLP